MTLADHANTASLTAHHCAECGASYPSPDDGPVAVSQGLRKAHGTDARWFAPEFPGRAVASPGFGVTIATLADFSAERYAADALRWARATLVGYGLTIPTNALVATR